MADAALEAPQVVEEPQRLDDHGGAATCNVTTRDIRTKVSIMRDIGWFKTRFQKVVKSGFKTQKLCYTSESD